MQAVAYSHLFSPLRIGPVTLQNRIIMAPMASHLANHQGMVTDPMIRWYVERARGGAGMIITESNYISLEGRGGVDRSGIHADDRVPGHTRMAEAVHAEGVPILAQLHHAGRQAPPAAIGQYPIGPSTTHLFVRGEDPWVGMPCRALAPQEVEQLVRQFGDAAVRAQAAGYDGVHLHGAHGYLINQFLSPRTNLRTDRYGGSPENRARFLLDIVDEVRRRTGPDFALVVRLTGDEKVPEGYRIDYICQVARWLEDSGVDAVDVSAGNFEAYEWMLQPQTIPEGCLVPLAAAVKQAVNIPVGVVGRIITPELVEQIVADGSADYVLMGRALIADPELPRKAREGRRLELNECVGCNRCVDAMTRNDRIICAVNPLAARETEYTVLPAEAPRRVLVVGGGVAGMEAALVASQRGHQVELYEQSDHLGGQAYLAGLIPTYYSLSRVVHSLSRQLQQQGVPIHLNTRVTKETVAARRPDVLILATGSTPEPAGIPGGGLPHVMQAIDVLAGNACPTGAVAILGGGLIGSCVAEYLAHHGYQVTVVKRSLLISPSAGITMRKTHAGQLSAAGVQILTGAEALAIRPDGVLIRQFDAERVLPADSVVVARGMRPLLDGWDLPELSGMEVHTAGDCIKPREILEAIHEAFHVARQI